MTRTAGRIFGLMVALCVLLELWERLLSDAAGGTLSSSMYCVCAIVGYFGYLRQARRATGRLRAGMRIGAAAAGLWFVLNALWVVTTPFGYDKAPLTVTLVQVFSLAGAAMAPVAVMLCVPGSGGAAVRLRRTIDVAMIFSALFIIAWQFVFQFLYDRCGPVLFWVNLVMMSIELATAAISLVLLSRSASHGPNAVNLLSLSMVMYASSTVVMTSNTVFNRPWFTGGVAAGYLVASFTTGWGGWVAMPRHSSLLAEQTAGRWMSLPYLPVIAAFGVAGWQQAQAGTLGPVLPWVLLGTASIMLFRQFLNARSHHALLVQVSEHRAELAKQAVTDPLTGLGNRSMFTERAALILADATSTSLTGVIVFDLDGFKGINDTWGHAAGDVLLCGVATRMAAVVRHTDTVVRFGGDEFVILLPELPEPGLAEATAHRVLAALGEPLDLPDITVRVRASAGVSVHQGADTDIDVLFHEADTALYTAKRRGKAQVCRFGVEQPPADAKTDLYRRELVAEPS